MAGGGMLPGPADWLVRAGALAASGRPDAAVERRGPGWFMLGLGWGEGGMQPRRTAGVVPGGTPNRFSRWCAGGIHEGLRESQQCGILFPERCLGAVQGPMGVSVRMPPRTNGGPRVP